MQKGVEWTDSEGQMVVGKIEWQVCCIPRDAPEPLAVLSAGKTQLKPTKYVNHRVPYTNHGGCEDRYPHNQS